MKDWKFGVLAGLFTVAGALLLFAGCTIEGDVLLCFTRFGLIGIVFGVLLTAFYLYERLKIKAETTFGQVRGHVVRCPIMMADALIMIDGKTRNIEIRCPNIDVMREGYCTKESTAIKSRYCAYITMRHLVTGEEVVEESVLLS